MMRIVLLEPGQRARLTEIEPTLEAMQTAVGGWIEAVYPEQDQTVCLICNEEGKLLGLPLNRALHGDGRIRDVIAGTAFLCACRGEHFAGLTEEQARQYREKYELPERIFFQAGQVCAMQYEPERRHQGKGQREQEFER